MALDVTHKHKHTELTHRTYTANTKSTVFNACAEFTFVCFFHKKLALHMDELKKAVPAMIL